MTELPQPRHLADRSPSAAPCVRATRMRLSRRAPRRPKPRAVGTHPRRALQVATATAVGLLAASPPATAGPEFIRGVAFGHHTDIDPKQLLSGLAELKSLGANHVSLVVQWSMQNVRTNRISPRKNYTTSDASLRRMIREAKKAGLKVLLFPILEIRRRKPLEWRGTIKPPRWDSWWQSYERFILHYAKQAATGSVEILCVGSELVSTEDQRQRWQRLLKRVRTIYRGKLLYSANWDHYTQVSFWDLVDVVGLTAYYGLASKNDATEEKMLAAWNRHRKKLRAWARSIGRPIVFTEVGYPSLDGGAVNPWDYTQGTVADPEEQRRAYRAFVRSWTEVKELGGVFFWDWYGHGGVKDKRYTPRGKPAAKVIERWFKRKAPAPRRNQTVVGDD